MHRSSSNASERAKALALVPDNFKETHFRLPATLFKLKNHSELEQKNEELNGYLEIIDCHLVKSVSHHFDRFSAAFESFDGMRSDMSEISD